MVKLKNNGIDIQYIFYAIKYNPCPSKSYIFNLIFTNYFYIEHKDILFKQNITAIDNFLNQIICMIKHTRDRDNLQPKFIGSKKIHPIKLFISLGM